jgi:hypothetical protein
MISTIDLSAVSDALSLGGLPHAITMLNALTQAKADITTLAG